jgi:hypothetical protein
MRFALRESTRQISLKCPTWIAGLGCGALSTSSAAPVADMSRTRQSMAAPSNAIVARFRTRWRRVAVVRSWRLRPGGSIDWFRGPSRSRLLSQSRFRVRNRSNDAGEFYEVINIGDAGPRNFTGAGSGRMPCEVDDRSVNLARPVANLSAACVARSNRIIPQKQ